MAEKTILPGLRISHPRSYLETLEYYVSTQHMTEEKDHFNKQIQDHLEYLDTLFGRAHERYPIELLFALLRVDGVADQNWDPFEESQRAFKEFNWLIEKADKELSDIASSRIALLMYCQAVEMTAPHNLLANVLQIIAGNRYQMNPFIDLYRLKKKGSLRRIPPSATAKMRRIKKLAKEVDEDNLIEIIDSFFDDQVRNAFSHSDYIITQEYFRWTDGGRASQMPIAELEQKIKNCFAFYGALLECSPRWCRGLGKSPRYHKLPRYEVLEFLKDNDGLVTGFKMHFSTGSYASYSRGSDGSLPFTELT